MPIKFVNINLPSMLVLIFLLCSCSGGSGRIMGVVEYWQGREIIFPFVMTDVMSGDTIDITDADFTIVTYVDSVGCTGCKMKLSLWKEFLKSLDSVCDLDVRFLMVVYPSDIKELHYILKRDDFDYPVYLDDGNKISTANSFPEEIVSQTFLLNRNRKVTAIGNPVYSTEIAKLYRRIISGQMSISAESNNVVSVSDNRISIGNLHPGEAWSQEIIFSNHGNDTVCTRESDFFM